MDSNSDLDDLPYVVWYQCRMCTGLFFDDIEKMFIHFDKKHEDMIDCEELRSVVYKNGLSMGGLPRSPKPVPKSEDSNDAETEITSPNHPCVDDDDDDDDEEFNKFHLGEQQSDIPERKVPIAPNSPNEEYDDENYAEDEAIVEEEYEESTYQSNNDRRYSRNVHDDEEQLAEGDFDLDANGFGDTQDHSDEVDTCDENSSDMKPSVLCQPADFQNYNEYNDDEEQQDEDDYTEDGNYEEQEEGELPMSMGHSPNDDEMNGLMYDEEEYDDEEDEDIEDEAVYSMNGNQSTGLLNYGFSCKYCGKFFTTRRGVDSHEQHHKNQASPIIRRFNEPKLFPCKICKNKSFSSFKDLKSHVKTHTPDRIHICKFCFSTFNNTASLTKHLTIHTRENPHKCHCGKTFVSANTLKIHKKIHTGIKPFVCSFYQCGKAFVTKSTLESHFRTHTGEKPYKCAYCSSSFTTSSAKYRHERHVHKVPDPSAI